VKIAFLFFLLITHWCGAPASWAARHTTVCLDHMQLIFLHCLFAVKKNATWKNYSVIDSPIHGNTMVQISPLYAFLFVSCNSFTYVGTCNSFPNTLLQIDFWVFYRAETWWHTNWNFARQYIWLCRLLILSNQDFEKCTIVSGFHRSGHILL